MPRLGPEEREQAFERLWQQSKTQPYMIKTTEAPHYRRYVIQHQIPKAAQGMRPRAFIPAGVNDGQRRDVRQPHRNDPSNGISTCRLRNVSHAERRAGYQDSPIFQSLAIQIDCRANAVSASFAMYAAAVAHEPTRSPETCLPKNLIAATNPKACWSRSIS
ncbi:MAG: hypothetical protein R3C56_34365 [Pirellulaceae bacterium]